MKFRPAYRKSALQKYQEAHPVQIYEGASLTTAQRKIADKVTTGENRFTIWCAGRQVGKSFTATQILLWFALNKPNTVSMYVSMTYNQTLKLFNELYRGIKDSGIIASYSKANFEIEFKNGSKIYFRSYQNADSSRGYTISGGILIVDEAAFMDDGDFDRIYWPMVQNHRDAKVLLISSPRGCNWFHKYYLKGCRHTAEGVNNKNYVSFKTTYRDNPFCDLKEIEQMKATMPKAIYQQEIEAEFVSGASSAFGNKYVQCISNNISKTPKYDERYYMGVDVGRQDDFTVGTVISAVGGEVVDYIRLNKLPFAKIADEIVKLALKWRPKVILQEVNGVGDPMYDILNEKLQAKKLNVLQSFTTTNQSKNNIIEALNIAFEEKSIKIPDDVDITDELDAFEVQYSPKTRSITYGARSGKHDDIVMSMAFANWARRTMANAGVYGVV